MNTSATPRPIDPATAAGSEQLTLLPNTDVNTRFRLSKDTRERGLRHVAEIRQMLAARSPQHVANRQHDRAA